MANKDQPLPLVLNLVEHLLTSEPATIRDKIYKMPQYKVCALVEQGKQFNFNQCCVQATTVLTRGGFGNSSNR